MKEKICQLTGRPFEISELEILLSEQNGLSLPNICPEERFRRLISFVGEKQFFPRTCSQTGQKLYSCFSPQSAFPVFANEFWHSEDWDPLDFGREFDFKRLFLEQLTELWKNVPRPATRTFDLKDSRIVDNCERCADSFLLFDSEDSRNCLYSTSLSQCTNCVDCYHLARSTWCYETSHSVDSEYLRFCEYATRCKNSWFLYNCHDCENCLFSANIQGKKHYIFNQPVDEEVYAQTIRELNLGSRPLLELAKNRFTDFLRTQTIPHILSLDCSGDELSGNYLRNCQNTSDCFASDDSRDIVNGHFLSHADSVLDGAWVKHVRGGIQLVSVWRGKNLLNCLQCSDLEDSAYCHYCESSRHLFACVGLRNKEFCILNKQYSAGEYHELRAKIERHLRDRSIWGAFLPSSFSCFTYNHSSANEYMPLTKIPAKMMGFSWDESDQALRPSQLLGEAETAPEELFAEIPERSEDLVCASLPTLVFLCSMTGKPYQITLQEYECYQKLGLPPAAICFQQRHIERLARSTPHQLVQGTDFITKEPLKTAFPGKWKQPIQRKNL